MKSYEVSWSNQYSDGERKIWIRDDINPEKAFSMMAGQIFGLRKSAYGNLSSYQTEEKCPDAPLKDWEQLASELKPLYDKAFPAQV